MIETQNQFDGGINTRLPAHQIGANQLTEAVDVDLSHGDLRGQYQMVAGKNREFFYESGDTWVSDEGTQGATTIYDFPVNGAGTQFVAGTGYTLSNGNLTLTTTQTLNFFRGTIPNNGEIIIGDGFDLTLYDVTRGIQGANSFVEYSKDLYISRSNFDISGATWSNGATTISTGVETYKIQIGDILSHANLPVDVVVVDVDDTADTVTLSEATLAAESSGVTVSVKPIISKYVDGDTTTSFRVGAQSPIPVISYSQLLPTGVNASAYNSSRSDATSLNWIPSTIPIPFQYFLSFYDETGNESKISDGTSIALGTNTFSTTYRSNPQYINITGITRASATSSRNGRYALYRVGGTSAIIKRCANLYLDTQLTVSVTKNGVNLEIEMSGAQTTHKYKIRWYSYSSSNYDYNPTNYTNAVAGETDYKTGATINNTSGADFTLGGNSSNHYVDLQVIMQIPGETIEREYVAQSMTVHNADVSGHARSSTAATTTGHDFIDFLSADALADVQPIEEDKTPVRGLSDLIESNNIFYAIKDNRVYASEYGNPNNWPEFGYLDFEQPVTGLGRLTGELVVFTEFGVHRVFGSDPLNLRKVQIPTVEGVPNGLKKSIASYQGGVMFASHNGVCFYNGTGIQVISENLLDDFNPPNTTPANNTGGVYDNVYYLLGGTGGGNGFKVDFKTGTVRVANTSMKATGLFYRGATSDVGSGNTLYGYDETSNNVTLDYLNPDSSATRGSFSAKTREFTGGDINSEKMFYNASISGTGFNGTVEIIVDGVTTDTFTVSGVSSSADFHRTFYTATPRTGNGALVRVSNASGVINKIAVASDLKNQLKRMLFTSVNIIYTGTPTVQVFVDGTSKISATALSAPTGNAGEATLYFPAMTTGVVPHLRETGDEASGRVVSFQYSATPT